MTDRIPGRNNPRYDPFDVDGQTRMDPEANSSAGVSRQDSTEPNVSKNFNPYRFDDDDDVDSFHQVEKMLDLLPAAAGGDEDAQRKIKEISDGDRKVRKDVDDPVELTFEGIVDP